jgi:hypothetical protein
VCIATFLIAKIAITAKIAKTENPLFPLCRQPGRSEDCGQLSRLIEQRIKSFLLNDSNVGKQLNPENAFVRSSLTTPILAMNSVFDRAWQAAR